jgi:sortase A
MSGVQRLVVLATAFMVVGCSAESDPERLEASPTAASIAPADPSATATDAGDGNEPAASDGRPRRARLSIPAVGVRNLLVVPYHGRTDDAAGTRIQDRGHAAAPFGPRGGTGPGGVGNFQVTAHRTSSTRAFELLPELRKGDKVLVEAGAVRYVYRIVSTRTTSFRSPRSLAEQRAPVPGRPGKEPVRAMITLSTCLTLEDHAAGNFWSDRFDNPEHRVDKIGVLVRTVPTD